MVRDLAGMFEVWKGNQDIISTSMKDFFKLNHKIYFVSAQSNNSLDLGARKNYVLNSL